MCRFTYHNAAMIVLDRTGKYLRSGGAEPVCQHDERTVVYNSWVVIGSHFNMIDRIFYLHYRAILDEQSCQVYRFCKRTSSVVSEIEYDAAHLFSLQFVDQFLYVTCRACVFGISFLVGFKVHVKRRQCDDTELQVSAIFLVVNDVLLGGKILQ